MIYALQGSIKARAGVSSKARAFGTHRPPRTHVKRSVMHGNAGFCFPELA